MTSDQIERRAAEHADSYLATMKFPSARKEARRILVDTLVAIAREAAGAARPMDDGDKAAAERLKLKATAEYDPYAKAVMVSVDDLKRVLAMVEGRGI